jgi:hypothetical protein
MSGAILLLPLHTFMTWTGTTPFRRVAKMKQETRERTLNFRPRIKTGTSRKKSSVDHHLSALSIDIPTLCSIGVTTRVSHTHGSSKCAKYVDARRLGNDSVPEMGLYRDSAVCQRWVSTGTALCARDRSQQEQRCVPEMGLYRDSAVCQRWVSTGTALCARDRSQQGQRCVPEMGLNTDSAVCQRWVWTGTALCARDGSQQEQRCVPEMGLNRDSAVCQRWVSTGAALCVRLPALAARSPC